MGRPVPVVVEHGVRCRARRPADRPRLLAAAPQEFERFTAVGGQRVVRALDGADAVLGFDPSPPQPNGGLCGAVPGKASKLGAAERAPLGLFREP
eukprot:3564821-Alexandrium_andersonii.AAC.1